MSRGYSVEQWLEWIEEQHTSGVSIAAFCEWIGVSANAFYLRRRQLAEQLRSRQQSRGRNDATEQQGLGADTASFVSLKVVDSRAAHSPCPSVMDVELPGGTLIRVNDRQVAGQIVSVILEYGASR